MSGQGEAATPQTLDAIMAESWEEAMGAEREEIPEAFEHLGNPNDEIEDEKPQEDTSLEPEASEDAPEELLEETDTPEEEPVEEPISAEGDDPEDGPEDVKEAPEHWSSEDREMFTDLDDGAKDFLLRRHKQMEGDYTRKTQENAEAIKIGRLVDEGMDPAIKADLRRMGVDNESYMRQMLQWHHQSANDPAGFARNIVKTLKLDPAKVFENYEGEVEKPLDPTDQRIQAVEQHLNKEQQDRYQKNVQDTQSKVDAFSQEKDDKGNLVRPHFEAVRKVMAQFVRVDPDMSLADAYEAAVYKDPELRKELIAQPLASTSERTQKALRATKSNIKSRPGKSVEQPKDAAPMSLHDAMSAAADEVGL